MKNKEEGNLISFKVFMAKDGNIISEFSHLPLDKVHTIFKHNDDIVIVEKIIKEGYIKLEPLHKYLEKEIQAISFT
jgi:hypothetical protein